MKCEQVITTTNIDDARVVGKDFDDASITNIIDNDERNKLIVSECKKKAGDSCIVYCRTKAHAQHLVDELVKQGIKAETFLGDHTKNERENKINRLIVGEIEVVVNYGALREGFNFEGLKGIIRAVPTKSENEYVQSVGRVTRVEPETGKFEGWLLDFKDQTTVHTTVGPAILSAIDVNLDPEGRSITAMADAMPKKLRDADGEEDESARLVGTSFSDVRYVTVNVNEMTQYDALPQERENWINMDCLWYVLRGICSPAPKGSASVYRYRATEKQVPSWQMLFLVFKHVQKWVAARVDDVSITTSEYFSFNPLIEASPRRNRSIQKSRSSATAAGAEPSVPTLRPALRRR